MSKDWAYRKRQFDRAQAQYEAQLPPGFDDPEFEVDECDDHDCGQCRWCVTEEAEAAMDAAAEAKYEARKERERGY